jgi:hypothetical protein
METEREAILRRRQELRAQFGAIYDRVSSILFEEDPGGVNFDHNTDEYESEVDMILPHLRACTSVDDVEAVLVVVLRKMFDEETIRPRARIQRIANLIWSEICGSVA